MSYSQIPNEHVVYILKIKDKEIYKIGYTNKLSIRLRNLSVSLYEQFDVIKTFRFNTRKESQDAEKAFHTALKLAGKQITSTKSTEWFNSISIV